MTGFIPEITTTVETLVDTTSINDAINLMQDDDILSQCFSEIIDYLENKKDEFENIKDPLAEKMAESLSSHQGRIIRGLHYQTGMMANSVDVSHDGDGVYLVGNTATSVDGFPYPLAIEKGTVGHYVAPVTFDALHWIDKESGENRFSKGHYVTGIKADPYVDDSIDLTMSVADDYINEIVSRILGG